MFQRERSLMIPWLGITFLLLILFPVGVIITIVFELVPESKVSGNFIAIVVFIVLSVITYSIEIHFFLVVYSYFKELGRAASPEGALHLHEGEKPIQLEEPRLHPRFSRY
ncbi:unnamed protein product [Darwinula stevensoni]|uniref:Uncharacterized protein n=1 Tax=Darwinula stevensoni TaxID=69355 RepID=A0A7R9FSX9_9CRUS|nr:unnamed protein product [Darwinula stevensoni]CAG0904780.1 unnamed protein product [Darwinula stevensoni]